MEKTTDEKIAELEFELKQVKERLDKCEVAIKNLSERNGEYIAATIDGGVQHFIP